MTNNIVLQDDSNGKFVGQNSESGSRVNNRIPHMHDMHLHMN